MIAIIKCQTCQEIMGQIEKPVITQDDIEMYQASMICSQGHTAASLEEHNED